MLYTLYMYMYIFVYVYLYKRSRDSKMVADSLLCVEHLHVHYPREGLHRARACQCTVQRQVRTFRSYMYILGIRV